MHFYSEQAKEAERAAGRFEGKNEDGTPKVKEFQVVEPAPQAETEGDRKARARAGKLFGVSGKSVSEVNYAMEHGRKADLAFIPATRKDLIALATGGAFSALFPHFFRTVNT